jgi:membrane dipeptidase
VRASGLTAVNVTVSGVGSYAKDYDATIRNIAYWNAQIAAHADVLLLVRTTADIAEAKRSKRLGLIFGFQDATPIAEDLERVDTFGELGVRVFQLTYNRRNLVGDGCLEPGNAGLSKFGQSYVERLNERRYPDRPFARRRAHHAGGDCRIQGTGCDLAHRLRGARAFAAQ